MPSLPLIFRLVLAAIVVTAALYDWRFRKIPNWLNLSGLILGLGLNLLYFAMHGAVTALEGLLLASAIYLPLYLLRAMGAGDVKLMAALGSLLGPSHWLQLFVATVLVGGILALTAASRSRRLKQTLWNVWLILQELRAFRAPHKANPELDVRSKQSMRLPHAVTIAVGCAASLSLSSL